MVILEGHNATTPYHPICRLFHTVSVCPALPARRRFEWHA